MTNPPGDGEPQPDPYAPPTGQPDPHGQPSGQPDPFAQPPGQSSLPYPPPPAGSSYAGPPTGSPYGGPPAGPPPAAGPYGAQPPYGYPAQGFVPDHPKATTSLVLGILGIVLCGILAPFAWRIGKKTVEEIDGSNGQVGGRGAAQAGYVLGLIGTILLGLAVVFGLLFVVLAIVGVVSGSTSQY